MLSLFLRSTAVQSNNIRNEEISLLSVSSTSVNELKHSIQETFSIPSCVQVLKWEGLELKGERRLQDYGIRSEDEITVEYYSEGECVSVQESVQWMSTVIDEIKLKGLPTKSNGIIESIPQLEVDNQTVYFRRLWSENFYPWKTPIKYTNKLYFIALGGLELLLKLYSLVLQNEWIETPLELKYTEFLILHAFLKFCENFTLQRLSISHGVLDMFIQSLLRAKVQTGKNFTDEIQHDGWNDLPDLGDIVDGAIGALCNFCELPEGQQYILSKPSILKHSLDILLNPGFVIQVTLSVVEMMMQVANTTDSHHFLSQPSVIETLVGIPYHQHDSIDQDDYKYVCLSKYSSLQCIARVFLVSPHMLSWLHSSLSLTGTIMGDIADMLQKETLEKILEYEEELGYNWCTLKPNISVLWRPSCYDILPGLQIYCQELIVASLHIILSSQNHREVLVQEGLLDYVISLPWHTSGSVQQRAEELVAMIQQASDVNVQPPSLLNMTKATVTKYYCGMDKVLELSVPELVWEILRQ